MTENRESLLSIRDFGVSFQRYDSRMGQTRLQVISNLHLTVYPGEILAVVGSSGSGKSLLTLAILGMLPLNAVTGGEILYRGKELTPERQKQLRGKKIALVPQSVTFLDPLMKTGKQADGQGGTGLTQKRRDIFRRLGLPGKTENLYPFQLSGGMARRVLVSTALLTEAELILADEPTPGMSLEQALEALRMFREMAEEGRAVLLITHDLDLAVEFADRVAVFYAGTTVETARASDFQNGPDALRHPYSRALWESLPQNGFRPVDGFQPYAGNLPGGCPYAPRCPLRTARCETALPPVRTVRGGEVRCYDGA